MALSTRKKNIIIAEWKTGRFKSITACAKHFKIDFKTARNLVQGISKENAEIVDTLEVIKNAENSIKNSVKSPQELKAIENLVDARMKVHNITYNILDGIDKLVKNGKAQKVVTESLGESGSSASVVEYDLQADDYKKAQEAVDKASLTLGINQRHANQNINVNTQNNTMVEIDDDYIRGVIEAFDEEH